MPQLFILELRRLWVFHNCRNFAPKICDNCERICNTVKLSHNCHNSFFENYDRMTLILGIKIPIEHGWFLNEKLICVVYLRISMWNLGKLHEILCINYLKPLLEEHLNLVDFPGECCIWDLSYVHVYANGNKNSRFCLRILLATKIFELSWTLFKLSINVLCKINLFSNYFLTNVWSCLPRQIVNITPQIILTY